jgi:hypothetical protein
MASKKTISKNSTNTALAENAIFEGSYAYVAESMELILDVITDQEGMLYLHWSRNGTDSVEVHQHPITAGRKYTTTVSIHANYVKATYKNGAVAQSTFILKILSTEFVENAEVSIHQSFIDSFNRIRISFPLTLYETKFLTSSQPQEYDELITGTGGSVDFQAACGFVDLKTTAGQESKVVRQTFRYHIYQPGKSILSMIAACLETSGGVSGVTARFGIFDDSADKTQDTIDSGDGFFFQMDGTTFGVAERRYRDSTQTDYVVTQANFNVDKLDGSGPSKYNLNLSLRHIFYIQSQWVGVGYTIMGVFVNGRLIPCHAFNDDTSDEASPYNVRASLPVRFEISSTSSSVANATLRKIAVSVISEGGFTPIGNAYSADRGNDSVSVSGTERPLLSIRLKSSRIRGTISPLEFTVMSSTVADMMVRVYIFCADTATPLTNDNWQDAHGTSMVEYDKDATAITFTDKKYMKIYSTYFADRVSQSSSFLHDKVFIGANIVGYSQMLVITAERMDSGSSERVYASITWKEYE